MVQEPRNQVLAPLRQQIMALASISGVMLAALRRAGLMTDDLEKLLNSELAAAAAAQSDQAEPEWERMVSAVQKIAAGVAKTE